MEQNVRKSARFATMHEHPATELGRNFHPECFHGAVTSIFCLQDRKNRTRKQSALSEKYSNRAKKSIISEITETTIFEGSKNSEIQILGCFLLYFHQNRTRERATSRISANFFFQDIRKFRGVRKKWCRFQEKLFSCVF